MRIRVAAIALLVAGCEAPGVPEPAPPATERLVFKMMAKERTIAGCIAGDPTCTYVRLDYPVLVEAPEGYAVDAVTDAVFSRIIAHLAEDGTYPNVDAVLNGFIDGYLAFKAEQPNYQHAWFLERKAFVLHNTPEVLSLSFSEHVYTGGAHGISTLHFSNLDPRTGKPIELSQILAEGFQGTLLTLGEARFREVRGIGDDTSLSEAGFTFEDDAFRLTDNVAIGEEGLTFYYNVYEIAPYALGSTEVFLSYDEIGDSVKRR